MKLFITLISIMFLIIACEKTSQKKVFKIGTNVWPGYESLHLAQIDKLYSTNIKVSTYDSATLVLNKFRKKEIDAAALTLDEAILLHDQEYNPVIVAVLDISNGADSLIVQDDIKSLSDLKDKSIGVENTALGSYILARVLEKAKLNYEDITLVPLVVNRHKEAFKEKVVDAVITFEPVRSKLLELGGVEMFNSKDISGEIVDVLVVQSDLISTKYVSDVLQGWGKSTFKINKRDNHAVKIISKRLKQNEKEFTDSLQGIKIPSIEESNTLINDGALESTITKISDIMFEKKLIKSKANPKKMLGYK